jgi:hypothetical protein
MTCTTCTHLRKLRRWAGWVCIALPNVALIKTITDSHCRCYLERAR